MSAQLIAFLVAAFFFVVAGLNWQFTMNAIKTQIQWQWFGVAALIFGVWILK